ncbi:MAG: hypothetical protein MHM6MM_000292 [Cercozoa sp. M6MM]
MSVCESDSEAPIMRRNSSVRLAELCNVEYPVGVSDLWVGETSGRARVSVFNSDADLTVELTNRMCLGQDELERVSEILREWHEAEEVTHRPFFTLRRECPSLVVRTPPNLTSAEAIIRSVFDLVTTTVAQFKLQRSLEEDKESESVDSDNASLECMGQCLKSCLGTAVRAYVMVPQVPVHLVETIRQKLRPSQCAAVEFLLVRQRPSSPRKKDAPTLRILHFNDVYHLREQSRTDPVGGAARFVRAVRNVDATRGHGVPSQLCLFSGDCFSPSTMSSATHGSHMVPIMNEIGVKAACFGNHDFDFGFGTAQKLTERCHFPWLLSNLRDGDGCLLASAMESKVIKWRGCRVGLMGLVEQQWVDTLNSLPESGLEYEEFVSCATRLEQRLREKENCDIVIALTHMRLERDVVLAREVPQIDLVLGGHDHFYRVVKNDDGKIRVVKSGTDFECFSIVDCFNQGGKWRFDVRRVDITSDIEPQKSTLQLVDQLTGDVEKTLDRVIGEVAVPLDCRFETVRTRESNAGNFITDLMREEFQCDIAMIAGGTIRGNKEIPAGSISIRTVLSVLPFEDPSVVLEVSGRTIVAALENGVSGLPSVVLKLRGGIFIDMRTGDGWSDGRSLPACERTQVHVRLACRAVPARARRVCRLRRGRTDRPG